MSDTVSKFILDADFDNNEDYIVPHINEDFDAAFIRCEQDLVDFLEERVTTVY